MWRSSGALRRLSGGLRYRAALALALIYGFCVLLPHAAMALGGAPGHCLTEMGPAHIHQPSTVTHVHRDGTPHTHTKHSRPSHDSAQHDHQGADDGSHANCCGLFCLSAMTEEPAANFALSHAGAALIAGTPPILSGHAPGRINRPPIG